MVAGSGLVEDAGVGEDDGDVGGVAERAFRQELIDVLDVVAELRRTLPSPPIAFD